MSARRESLMVVENCTRRHMATSIRGLILNHPMRDWPQLFTNDAGDPVTIDEVWDEIREAIAKGYDVLPHGQCDNVQADGSCGGHPVVAAEEWEGSDR